MAICKTFDSLTITEKRELAGFLWHLVQTDDNFCKVAQSIIVGAKQAGKFRGVQVFPATAFSIIVNPENE